MRMYCPVEGYADSYVEFTDYWSRADIRKFARPGPGESLDVIRSKVTAVHVKLMDGEATSAEDITEDTLDRMQWEVFQWFMTVPQLVVKTVLDLGEETRRQLLLTLEDSQNSAESVNA